MSAELTPGGVDSARHPSEVGEMSASVLVEGHSVNGIVVPQQNDSYPAAKLLYARRRRGFTLNFIEYNMSF